MKVTCAAFTSLCGISARFAARLVRAGALAALMRLGAQQPGLCGEAARHVPGAAAGAGAAAAHTYGAVLDCTEAFALSVPQVEPWAMWRWESASRCVSSHWTLCRITWAYDISLMAGNKISPTCSLKHASSGEW